MPSVPFKTIALLAFLVTPILQFSPAQEAESKPEAIKIAEIKREKPVDFEKEILPLFRESCLACHNATDAKGELVLETPEKIRKGGENGAAVVPGKAAESLLLKLASHQEKPVMPPRKNKAGAQPLTPDQLGLIALWIEQGATGTVSSALGPIAWQGLPPAVKSIEAVAVSQNGQFAACNRGNQIFVYRLPSKELMQVLADPDLPTDAARGPIADRDVIQSLAFSPEGDLLAAGCYRAVKFWKLPSPAPQSILARASAGPIQSIATSPDGKWFASGGADGLIRMSDASGGKMISEISGHTAAVSGLVFSRDGARLASVSKDKTIRVWNSTNQQEIIKKEFPAEILSVDWGDKYLCAGFADNVIRIFEMREGKELASVKELSGHNGPITSLALVQNRLLSGSKDKSVRLWNTENWQQVQQLDQGDEVTAVAFRHDGKRVASAGMNHLVKLWNAEDGKLVATIKGDASAQEFAAEREQEVQFAKQEVDFFKDSLKKAEEREKAETEALKKATEAKEKTEKAFTEKSDAFKKASEAKTAAEKAKTDLIASIEAAQKQKPDLEKQNEELASSAKALAAKTAEAKSAFEKIDREKNGLYQQIIDAGFRAKLAALDLEEVKKSKATNEVALAEKSVAERKQAAEGLLDKVPATKVEFDKLLAAQTEAIKLSTEAEAKAKTAAESLAAAEKLLASADQKKKEADQKITSTGKQAMEAEAALKLSEGVKNGAMQAFEATTGALKRAGEEVQQAKTSITRAEEVVAQTVRTLDQARASAAALEKPIYTLAFSPDNRVLLFAGEDGVARSVTADDGKFLDSYSGHGGKISALAFISKDSFVTGSSDQSARIWKVAPEWTFARRIGSGDDTSPFADRVLALKFSPDGQAIATGGGFPSRSGEIKIWQVSDGTLIKEFRDPHSDTVLSLDWSRDGKLLASGGADKFLRVFEAASGKQIRSFEGHTHHVLGVGWKANGRVLASAGADKVVKVWDFASGEQRKTIEGFGKEVTALTFVAGTNEILTGSGNSELKLVREDGGQVRNFGGSSDYIASAAATPDGKTVIAGALDGTMRVWNGRDGKLLATFAVPGSAAGR